MGTRDDRVDAYIAKSADFARPILTHLRDIVHAACPDVEETMKWSFPHFMYKGILCSMAAFKEHCSFGLWKSSLIIERGSDDVAKGMGQFGQITDVSDLPSKRTRKLWPPLRNSLRAISENISSGSPRPRPTPRVLGDSKRRSNGWPRASRETGNT